MGLLKLQRMGNMEENSEKEDIVNPAGVANSCELGCLRRPCDCTTGDSRAHTSGGNLGTQYCLLRVALVTKLFSQFVNYFIYYIDHFVQISQ